jgi:hypothetical protein
MRSGAIALAMLVVVFAAMLVPGAPGVQPCAAQALPRPVQPPTTPPGALSAEEAARSIKSAEVDLTCFPALMSNAEGRWTFFLRGGAAFQIKGARLHVAGQEYPATRIDFPTPNSALVDLEYGPLPPASEAQLVLEGASGELTHFTVAVVPPSVPPAALRQRHLIRVQLRPFALDYPLHSPSPEGAVQFRRVSELGGDPQFLMLLQELGIERVRKALSRYAENDSIHWNATLKREDVIGGPYLRQYLLFLDEARSEDAFKEILLAFPQVEGAFVNSDRSKKPEPK